MWGPSHDLEGLWSPTPAWKRDCKSLCNVTVPGGQQLYSEVRKLASKGALKCMIGQWCDN